MARDSGPEFPVNINVRMTPDQLALVQGVARSWGVSLSAAARHCIEHGARELEGSTRITSSRRGASKR